MSDVEAFADLDLKRLNALGPRFMITRYSRNLNSNPSLWIAIPGTDKAVRVPTLAESNLLEFVWNAGSYWIIIPQPKWKQRDLTSDLKTSHNANDLYYSSIVQMGYTLDTYGHVY